MNFVEVLPQEVAIKILQLLPLSDRATCCLVDRAWKHLTSLTELGPILELRPKEVSSHARTPCELPSAFMVQFFNRC
jgi:hypothetical protein